MFSLEMSRYEIGMRLLCSEATRRVGPDPQQARRSGRLVPRGRRPPRSLHDVPLHIVDAGNVNIVDIRAKARRMRTGRQGLELIIVDYLQLMTSPLDSPSRQPPAGGGRDQPFA